MRRYQLANTLDEVAQRMSAPRPGRRFNNQLFEISIGLVGLVWVALFVWIFGHQS